MRASIKRVCETCGHVFFINRPSILKIGKARFCSRKCIQFPRIKIWQKKDELQNLYVTKRLSMDAIAQIFNVSNKTIGYWLRKYDIHIRTRSEALRHSIERRCQMCGALFYIKPSRIKRGYGKYCSHKCVSANPLIKEKRALSRRTFFVSEQELRQLYEIEKHTLKKIGGMFNVSDMAVRYWLKKYGIVTRTNSESHLGHTPWNKGKSWSQQVKDKIGQANSGRKKIHSEATKQKLSIAYKKLWANPERAKERFQSFNKRPNKPELALLQIARIHNLPLTYVGDGKTIIAGLFPDFIEQSENPKKIVELFGDYWHDPKRRKLEYYQTENGRKAIFAREGYDTLIIHENELSNPDLVSEKISNFLEVQL